MGRLQVALVATDPISEEGITSALRDNPLVEVVAEDRIPFADAGLVLARDTNSRILSVLESLDTQFAVPGRPIVLVAESIDEHQLVRAVRHGVVSFLPRSRATVDDAVRALVAGSDGGSALPPRMARTLVEEIRVRQRLGDREGTVAGGLTRREIEVLALMAEGMSTAAVAAKLNYSERTIKAVLNTLIKRLGLRNRAHAVAYAVRNGAV